MKELDELIQYWKDDHALNYIHHTPQHNTKVLQTIKCLETLKRMATEQNRQISFNHPYVNVN